jgi:hypothetical protein
MFQRPSHSLVNAFECEHPVIALAVRRILRETDPLAAGKLQVMDEAFGVFLVPETTPKMMTDPAGIAG